MDWNPNKQIAPQGDARYRIHKSVKCYVVSMQCGTGWCTLYLNESIERVLHRFPDGSLRVLYKTDFYLLHSPEELEREVRIHLAMKGGVNLLGGSISYHDRIQEFEPFHFINVTSNTDAENYERLKPQWLRSSNFVRNGKSEGFQITALSWRAAPHEHRNSVIHLLELSKEVRSKGLIERLAQAKLLAVSFYDQMIVGCGALKTPSPNYRNKCFAESKSSLDPENYPIELGYLAVDGKRRAKGTGNAIVEYLLSHKDRTGVYATTRSTNRRAQTILIRNGFRCEGIPYKSDRGKYSIMLWVLDP